MMVDHEGPETIREPGLFIGQELAYEFRLIPGDRVTIISPTETEGPLSAVPRIKRFIIEGVYHSGLPDQELHTVYASDASVRAFLRRADALNGWEVTVRQFDRAPVVALGLKGQSPAFKFEDWVQLNSHLFYSMNLERMAMFVILAFIVVVASFNIVTTLTLMVVEKKRDVSILRAMGATRAQVGSIFFAEGLLIGSVGVGVGAGFGFLVCLLLKRYEFITLPEIYYDRTLPVTIEPTFILGVAACAFLIVLVACIYPSRRASALSPMDGIRFG
jgi:lipoprotein-releasing system permease protein